jgi:hypothetical protein
MRLPPLTIELPTGRIVSISVVFDPLRPWEMQHMQPNVCTIVRRTHGGSGGRERLKEAGQRSGGLVLEREDAEVLMAALRSRISGAPSKAPTASRLPEMG